jgi:hypothetical protein
VRVSRRRLAKRSRAINETIATTPPAPAATPSDASTKAPNAIATALPPTTLLMTATTLPKVKYCRRPSTGTAALANTPSPSSWPDSRNRVARSPASCL